MKLRFWLFPALIWVAACSPSNSEKTEHTADHPDSTLEKPVIRKVTDRPSWDSSFSRRNYTGVFVLAPSKEEWFVHNRKRMDEGRIPASTFKVFNSLVILQEKAVADENEVLKWDGQKRWVKNWNQDLNMRQAIEYSAVWFYQEGARRVGKAKMQYWLDKAAYGNQIMGDSIDMFWLKGTTAITPVQQIEFLQQLYHKELPFDKKVQETVINIMPIESCDCCTIHAKTGWSDSDDPDLGWYVGWVNRGDAVAFFAMNMDMPGELDANYRKIIAKEILHQEGWWD